ncbi:hypothetical protein Clacol_005691 [Clathrus columnatus]|uniref:Cytochrome P450 n=1 Tax=Clathrus columnatus TaxID=1419009 RepID=A0AAV5AFM2_9AGAM|nr:hypothetical protein Clacol_005691 [Clathrus columnatus]
MSFEIRLGVRAFRQAGPGSYLIAVDPSHSTGFLWANPWPGRIGTLNARFLPYANANRMILSTASLVTPRTIFFVADPEVIKQVASDRTGIYEKDPQTYQVLNVYGHNIVSSNSLLWKKQRDAARSAFSEGHAQLMWKESCFAVREAIALLGAGKTPQTIDIPVFLRKVVLTAMSAGSYGRRLSYGTDIQDVTPHGFTQPFGVSLQTASEYMVPKWAIPRIAYKLPIPALQKFLSHMTRSYDELAKHFQGMIEETRLTLDQDDNFKESDDLYYNNLLRRLVAANTLEKHPSKRLTDKELLSNVYIFLLAGHETSAHTLSFILAHLALYPEVQNKVYEEIIGVWPTEEDAIFGTEEYTLAVIRESLRHFPVAPRLPKVALRDTILHSKGHGEFQPVTHVVPKGSVVLFGGVKTRKNSVRNGLLIRQIIAGLVMPSLPFSAGSRSCIGQRSGQAQIIGIMANLLRFYEIVPPSDLVDLPFAQRRDALLKCWLGSSLSPSDIKLVFSPRVKQL